MRANQQPNYRVLGRVYFNRQPLPIPHPTLLALHLRTGAGRNIPPKHQNSHLHHHPNCFSMSMQLAPPAEGYYEHASHSTTQYSLDL